MTAGAPSPMICPDCRSQVSADLLSCPVCHRLVHAERLKELSAQASAAEQRGGGVEALTLWREALALLPPRSRQYEQVVRKVDTLSRAVGQPPPTNISTPHTNEGVKKAGSALAIAGAIGLFLITKGKLLLAGLSKSGTFWTMFLSFAVYWRLWGWPFALGVVVCIYIHETGHVDMLRRYGFKATAPMFIPGLGALIRMKQHPVNAIEDARVGLAGPLWGLAAALACLGLYHATGRGVFAALTHVGAVINLFNLIPLGPLDGGRGFRALSRGQAWLVVLTLAAVWYFTNEGMLILVGLVALITTMAKSPEDPPDRTTLVQLVLLIVALGALATIQAPQRVR